MEIAGLYPYCDRERQAMIGGLRRIARELRAERGEAETEKVFNWIPEHGLRSINDKLRHIAPPERKDYEEERRQDQAVSKVVSELSTSSFGARNVNEGAH